MAPPRRWIRLDAGWSDTEWLAVLEPAARLAWVELLTYVKTDGMAGTVKAVAPAVFGRKYAIPAAAVQAMLDAAQADGALEVGDASWTVVKWAEYQYVDPTAKDRMRKHRAEKSSLSPLRRNKRNVTAVTDRSGVTRHATVTETITEEDANASSSELATPDPDVREVFEYWVTKTGRNPTRTKLTPGRRDRIRTRLKEFSAVDLKRAIDGVMASEHHRSQTDYTDLTSCFRSTERVENHIARATAASPKGQTQPTSEDRKERLRRALAMVRRQDPDYQGGLPDLYDHSFEVSQWDVALWNEVLAEAGLRPADTRRPA